jgi:hypothetical protein
MEASQSISLSLGGLQFLLLSYLFDKLALDALLLWFDGACCKRQRRLQPSWYPLAPPQKTKPLRCLRSLRPGLLIATQSKTHQTCGRSLCLDET